MAGFVAENRITGYGPAITVAELDDYVKDHTPVIIDIRDFFAYERSHIAGSDHIHDTHINKRLAEIPKNRPVLIYSDKGKKGHRVVRELNLLGYNAINISGGFPSLERHARAIGYENLHLPLIPVEEKSIYDEEVQEEATKEEKQDPLNGNGPLVLDVRTPEEFSYGAYPGAVNIPLDALESKVDEIGDKNREITLYCASGARSAYGANILKAYGFTNLKNGGGLMDMMAELN